MDKRRNLKERICAAVLVLALVLTGVLPDVGTLVLAADVPIPSADFLVYETYTDENGQNQEIPIKGANVIVAGAEGAVTDANGNCSVEGINVGANCTVSRDGYATGTINITGASNKIELRVEDIELSCGSQMVINRSENMTADIEVRDEIGDANALSYEWSSDNPDAIAVSNEGIVTAKQRGMVNITVKRGNAAKSVSVMAKEKVPFEFSINPVSGTNQTEVNITVGALPKDATGKVFVYKGTDTNTAIREVSSDGETFTWTETDSEKLQGAITFIAKYEAGTDDVYLNTCKELTGNYLKPVALNLSANTNTQTYTYGTDTSLTIANLFTVTGAGNGQVVHYISQNEDVAKVNEDGTTISITGAGTAVISAYVEEDKDNGYTASSADYTLKIGAKDIGEISLADFKWEAVDKNDNPANSKIYDGENSIRVRGTLEADGSNGIVGTDVITVYADAQLAGADAASYNSFVLKKDAVIDASQNTKYTFTIQNANAVQGEDRKFTLNSDTTNFGFKDNGAFEITKRAIYVKVQKKAGIQRIQYGDDLQSAVAANYEIGLVNGTGQADSTAEQGILEKDKSTIKLNDFAEPKLKTTDDSGNQVVFYVGEYPAYIFPAKKENAVDPSNYTIIADGTNGSYCADLTISQEIVSDDKIAEKIEMENKNVYEKDDGVKWVNGSSSITFSSKDNKYDEVVVKAHENELGDDVLEFTTFEEGKISEVSAKIYLKNTKDNNNDDTRTTASENPNEDNSLPYTIKVDKVCPTVKFNTLKRWETDLAFRVFRNSNVLFNESVSIYDGNEDKAKEDSGIASEEYAILTYEKAEDISDYGTFIEKLKDAENITWKTIVNKTIPVISKNAEKNKYYLVVVKAEDNVGNTTYAASNGLIYEQTSPTVSLTWKDTNKKYTEGVVVYGGDAEYEIKISDLEDMNAPESNGFNVFSGIEKINVSVITGEMPVQGTIDAEDKLVNSNIIEGMTSTSADIYTYDELTGKAAITKEGKIIAADCLDPDDVRINVTVTDLAGNEYKIPEQQIKFDITAPEIVSVEFDQNPSDLTPVVDNSYNNRTMTVTYKEHNFKEEWATFKIQEDKNGATGAEKTYTLKELKEGALAGVAVVDATSEGNIQNEADIHIYKIIFGVNDAVKDSVYSINEIRLSDHAQEDAVYGEKIQPFTVDNIKPQVTVTLNEKDADPVNKAYYKENCVMTVTYKEHNFYEDGLSFDVIMGAAEDFAENLSINFAQLNALDGITAKEDKKQSSGDTHVYEIIFDGGTFGDQDYKVTPHIKDKAGNAEEVTPEESGFTVDKIQPEVQVQLNSDQAVNESYYKENCVMTVTYTERNFYEDGLSYDIALGRDAIQTYTLKELKEIEGVTVGEPVITGNTHIYAITFDGGSGKDEDYRITPHIKDMAGNTEKETPAESAFTVDKTAPVLTAQYYYNEDTKKEPATTNEINRLYTNQKVKAVVTIKERNFMLADGFSAASEQMRVSFNEGGKPMSSSDNALKAMTGTGWKKLTDQEDTWEQTFEFDVPERTGDSDFDFQLNYKDLADNISITVDNSGNEPEATTKAKTYYLTVDKIAPELEVTYFEEDGETLLADADIMEYGTRLYQQKKVHATYEITERNFIRQPNKQGESAFEGTQMAVKYEYSSEVGTPTAYDKDAADAFKWTYKFDERTASQTFYFDTEANYTIGMTYKDLAGNEVVYKDHSFTVDWTAPTGEIIIPDSEKSSGGIWASGSDGEHDGIFSKLVNVVYNFFTKGRHTTTMTSSDVTAGVEGTYYYIDSSATGDKEVSPLSEADLDKITDWVSYSDGITVGPNSQSAVYEKIVDKSGNVTYINAAFGIISDSVNPTVTLTDVSATINGIHNSDAVVEVRVTDPVTGGVYSGIERVEYAIESRTNVIASETGTVEMSYDNLARERDQSGLGRIRVNAQKFNSNDVTVRATAYDNAGNSYTADIPLKIDVTAPVVENIAWNTSSASNGKYYNVTRTATISVRERNFDPNQVRLNITNTDGTMPQISGWSVDSSGTSDNNVSRCTVSFTSDGDYNMNMSCTDKAGWTSNTVTAEEFTIDKTVPTINVTFDNNNAANGKYYKESRTATITVNEHNFNGSQVQTAITSNTAAPGVNGWSQGSDVHLATVPFTTDGNYSFTVNYTDLAGNPAQVYSVEEFVVDQTKPEIEIFDIVDKSANNGEVAPGVRYSDTNYDVSGVSITYQGAQHDEKAVDGTRSNIPNGESIKMADFEHTAKEDDIYTMKAKVTDLAGNFDEKEVTFSVNRFGSNFRFVDHATEQFVDDYYNNEEKTLTIEEINVDTLTHRGITNSHDGDIADLEEGTDYTVKESGGEVSWKSYEYTIKKENFEQEGLYNITIDSVDRATNEATNKIKNVDIEFIIDKTAPTVVITGIENEGQYRTNERDITIAASDNAAMKQVEVYVDDNVEEFNAKTIKEQKGELPYTLTSSSDWQEIKAVAVDMAGNITDTSKPEGSEEEEWVSVLITSNVFVQFYRNTALMIGTIAVLIVLAGGIILLLAKRRRGDEKAAV